MRVEIHVSKFTLTDSLRNYIEKRVGFAFSKVQNQLRKVSVRLSDINGPRGGADKSCRIQIPLTGMQDLVIENVERDLYLAIDRAIERASHSCKKRLSRLRNYSRERFLASDISADNRTPLII